MWYLLGANTVFYWDYDDRCKLFLFCMLSCFSTMMHRVQQSSHEYIL